MVLKNNINNDYDSDPTAHFDAVGGKQNKQVTLSYPQKRVSTQSDYKEKQNVGLAELMKSNRRNFFKIFVFWLYLRSL